MTLRERLRRFLEAFFIGFGLTFLVVAVAGAAGCPDKGDSQKAPLDWGQPCSAATGSCQEPYRCLWPPSCRCDLNPLGMQRDPQAEGWQKPAEHQGAVYGTRG